MDEKYLEALEFDKIRARAADGIVCPEARGMLLGQPAWETPDEVRAALEQTDAMTTLLIKNGSPRFSSVENVRGIVQRAEKGGVLSMAELLTVADTLRNFRELVKWYGLTEHDVLPVDDLFYAMTPQPTLEKTIRIRFGPKMKWPTRPATRCMISAARSTRRKIPSAISWTPLQNHSRRQDICRTPWFRCATGALSCP